MTRSTLNSARFCFDVFRRKERELKQDGREQQVSCVEGSGFRNGSLELSRIDSPLEMVFSTVLDLALNHGRGPFCATV